MDTEDVGRPRHAQGRIRHLLIRSILAIVIVFIGAFYFADEIYGFLVQPYAKAADFEAPIRLVFSAPQEWFFLRLNTSLWSAAYLAIPAVFGMGCVYLRKWRSGRSSGSYLQYTFWAFLLFCTGGIVMLYLANLSYYPDLTGLRSRVGDGEEFILLIWAKEYIEIVMKLTLAAGFVFLIPLLVYVTFVPSQKNREC